MPGQLIKVLLVIPGQNYKNKPGARPKNKYQTEIGEYYDLCPRGCMNYGEVTDHPIYQGYLKVLGLNRLHKYNQMI